MENHPPNYPDILGYVTGGQQMLVSVIQAALALRPEVVPAGRPFEAIVMLQNTTDVNVEVTATVQLPPVDAAKVKRPFLSPSMSVRLSRCCRLKSVIWCYLYMPTPIPPRHNTINWV